MQHLEEGTIHAWLDGALDAEESARIEAHVASCEACSAAVAEARGLIAGTSRVLGALDHVPANVIPYEPARDGGAIAPAPKVRRFRVTPVWMTAAAAAVLVIAVSLSRGRSSKEVQVQASRPQAPARPPSAAGSANADAAKALGNARSGPEIPARRQREEATTPTMVPKVAATPASQPLPAAVVAPERAADVAAAKKAEARVAERSLSDSLSSANADSARAVRDERLKRAFSNNAALEQVVVTALPGGAQDADAESTRLAGCYDIASAVVNEAPPSAPVAAQRAERAAGVAASAPRARAPMPTSAFVLDSARAVRAGVGGENRNVVSASRGVIGSWVMLSPSSARVTFDDGRPALLLTRVANGAVEARPASDSTASPTVLRRCP